MSLDALSAFGGSGFSPLVDAGQEVVLPEIRQRLAQWGLGNSDLASSLAVEVAGDTLSIVVAPYGKYVSFGVKGTQGGTATPDEDGWIHQFGAKMPPASVFGVYTADKSAQFAIAKSVQKFGLRPRPFLPLADDPIWERVNEYLADRLQDGIQQNLQTVTLTYES
jgi:hypothetical protein